ncbi:MAG: hypothetical protein E7416_00550 [Ruminococcaceae bacterium]|nr:hypothetical protein [Oscillospiraceae bacterium]
MEKSNSKKMSDIIYYYKWYALAVIGVLAIVLLFVHECATTVKDDIVVNMLLSNDYNEDASVNIAADLEGKQIFADLNGDGSLKTYINIVKVPYNLTSEADISSSMQATVALATDDALLCLVDEDLLEMYAEKGFFEDIKEKLPAQIAVRDDAFFTTSDGKTVGISLKDNAYLEKMGISTKSLYACIRIPIEGSDEDMHSKKTEASVNILAHIIQQQ